MKEFFEAQIDYIYFVHGFCFFLLAWICLLLHGRQKTVMPWKWLGLFGLFYGISIWANLAVIILDKSAFLGILRSSFKAASFLFLIEFNRKRAVSADGKKSYLWVYPLLFFLVIPGWLGVRGIFLKFVSGHAFALTGCLWAALIAFRPNRRIDPLVGRLLRVSGAIFLLYALTLIRYAGPFIWLLQIFLSFSLAAVLWIYRYSCENIDAGNYQARTSMHFALALAAFIAVLTAGYFITDSIGSYYKDKSSHNFLLRVNTIASAIDQERLGLLSGSSADLETGNYVYLKKQIQAAHKVNRDFRFLYILGMRGRQVFFYLDSLPASDKDYSAPGDIFDEASKRLVESFSSGAPFVGGPTRDRWGGMGFWPLPDQGFKDREGYRGLRGRYQRQGLEAEYPRSPHNRYHGGAYFDHYFLCRLTVK